MLQPSVFKAYDVRGIYPTELDEDGAYRIGRAVVEHFEPRALAVGRDVRLSSPAMARALAEGALDGGADVVDIGLVGTEVLYHAVSSLGLDGGICVTASHNPREYTGMKIVRRGALPVGGDSGLAEIRALALGELGPPAPSRGSLREEDVLPDFVEKVLSFIDPRAIQPLRVVVDAANGMAGTMLPPVLERLPQLDVVRCFFEPDGSFPNHEPNPLLPENREFIVAKTRAEGADLGVAYDGDADRCFFVDDTGEFVPGDFVTALLAEAMLEREPGAKVIYDVRASWAVPETIERAGGVPVVSRVGHAFIKHRMRKEDAVFAGEVSAHYYFRDFAQADSGVIPFLLMLELLSRRGEKLSTILEPYRSRFFLTGEINTPVADVPLTLQELKERYQAQGARISHLDGLSVEFDDWHFNVRPSNTEPLLRLNLEALSPELMAEKRDEVLALIRRGRSGATAASERGSIASRTNAEEARDADDPADRLPNERALG
ncbi:MAG: phosphomannomutase/phosphoglucomutase [Thermoleophilia bacterium]|nr:phosphomannomutase/phosphoglucomutase [Gaiellaceae bacterium]MDW8338256.1 phosphomannomutase/phosphoglucomutase [Thermoleophilia bacterium]